MKVINEDIENLERFVGNKKVDIHAELPLIMADAYSASKKAQEEIDKEMEEHNKETEVELNKVLGAEEQPVPDVPEVPKATLEESLFEDADVRYYSNMLFDMIDEGLVSAETIAKDLIFWCPEDDIKRYMEVNDLISEEDLDESLFKDYKKSTVLNETLQDERIKNVKEYLESALAAVNSYLERTTNEALDDEDECLQEDTERDAYYDALDIPKGPERKKVAAERRQEFLKKFNLEDRAQEWKDAKGKGDPEEEEDIFTKINDELFPYDMEEVKLFTKFPGVSASKRYHSGEVTTDYDGNVIVHADAEDKFDFAKQVADAYGVEYEEPRNVRGEFIMRILTSKLED